MASEGTDDLALGRNRHILVSGGKGAIRRQEEKERSVGTFFEQVYGIVAKIPYGKVASYGQIARMLGNPRSARMVGWALSCCPEHLPWQRVVMADGSITGGGYADLRRMALEAEDVVFTADGRVEMTSCQWRPDGI